CTGDAKIYSYFPEKQIAPFKIAFLGFKSAIPEGGPDLFSNPLLHTIIRAEPVKQDISDRLSDRLYMLIEDSKNYNMINMRWDQKAGSINPGDMNAVKALVKDISADIVITGYVYRMQEREGGEYASVSPASVAFDLYFLDVNKAAVSWKGRYDKTQKSLSENLLDFKSFLKFKGKWADVDTLALEGLKELVDNMPIIKKSIIR
ncbi:MAG: hypothetical protein GX846_00810, partial [Deltaproteobacteria bacterium]|nr:hypothetical protein [Deltaproteobacteria bacterium]